MTVATIELVEQRSLALHQEVARRILADPGLIDRVRARVEQWAASGSVHQRWIEAWREILARSPAGIAAAITDPDETGAEIRQCSPFAGVVDAATRWQILRGLRTES